MKTSQNGQEGNGYQRYLSSLTLGVGIATLYPGGEEKVFVHNAFFPQP